MKTLRICTMIVARFLLSAIFLSAAMNKVLHWEEQERNLFYVFSEWQSYAVFSGGLQNMFSILVPWTPLLLIFATFCEFIGGFLLLLGIREKLGGALLLLFLIPATLIMHPFFFMDGPEKELHTVMFLKNMAILGGLCLVLLHGAQTVSVQSAIPSKRF